MRGIGIVKTLSGPVQGVEKNGITVFRSLPYAKAPAGELRWHAPVSPDPWTEVRICDTFGNIPWQPKGWVGDQALKDYPQDEDCLTLNLWTPAESSHENLPVFVWYHGGGYMGGVSHEGLYDGSHMAAKGVIVVSVSYRCGVFGFLAHPGLESEADGNGNFGMLDQIEGLLWVKRNIRAFGGDPNRITICGQSAGAASVAALLTSNRTRGLISAAIMQSSAPLHDRPRTLQDSMTAGEAFGTALGCKSIAELRALPASVLCEASGSFHYGGEKGLPFGPVIDGDILPMSPRQAFLTGKIAEVPMIFGNNSDEGLFGTLESEDAGAEVLEKLAPQDVDAFRAIYKNEPDRVSKVIGGVMSFGKHRALAEEMNRYYPAPIYQYYFSKPMIVNGENRGATHSGELFYVFYTLHCIGGSTINGEVFAPLRRTEDYFLSDNMCTYWANFVKRGDPNGPGLAEWKPTAENGSYMHFDGACGTPETGMELLSQEYFGEAAKKYMK